MPHLVFCTQCGTRGDAQAAFCDNCGTAVRKPPATPQSAPAATARGGAGASRTRAARIVIGAAAAVATIVIASVAFLLMNRAPEATPSALLAAAKSGYGPTAVAAQRRELCRSDLDYGKDHFLVSEWDRSTQDALNTLVAAGLYGQPERVQTGGFFAQSLLQYTPTPELAKYRDGQRLCLAKDVEIAEVTDIGSPAEQPMGAGPSAPKITMVRGTMVLRSIGTAAWLENPQVRDAVVAGLQGWEYRDHALQKRVPELFGVREGKWTTGPAYRAELDAHLRAASRREPVSGAGTSSGAGLWASMQRMFDGFGSRSPLQGRWRMAGSSIMGMELPEGLAPDITFTKDRIEVGGSSTPVRFEVDGDKVRVTAEGQSTATVFVLQGSDAMLVEGTGMRYRRMQ